MISMFPLIRIAGAAVARLAADPGQDARRFARRRLVIHDGKLLADDALRRRAIDQLVAQRRAKARNSSG